MIYLYICAFISISLASGDSLPPRFEKLRWLLGKWRSEYFGKVVWPTVPALTYGEEMEIMPAPLSYDSSQQYLRIVSTSWSHSTKDKFLDMYAYLTVDQTGNCSMVSTGNNGFSTKEVGPCTHGLVNLYLREVGRITIGREIPVEDLNRQLRVIDRNYIEQIISMRTAQHPRHGMLEHARILYERVNEPDTTPRPPWTTISTSLASNHTTSTI